MDCSAGGQKLAFSASKIAAQKWRYTPDPAINGRLRAPFFKCDARIDSSLNYGLIICRPVCGLPAQSGVSHVADRRCSHKLIALMTFSKNLLAVFATSFHLKKRLKRLGKCTDRRRYYFIWYSHYFCCISILWNIYSYLLFIWGRTGSMCV